MHTVAGFTANKLKAVIATGGDIDVPFGVGPLPQGADAKNCLLGYMGTASKASNLKVQVKLNDTVVDTLGPLDVGITRYFQIVCEPGLQPNVANNLVNFRIVGGTGSFGISNVVVWFHQNVA